MATIGQQYLEAAQFMLLTKAIVEMMTRAKTAHMTLDYLQYAEPTSRFYNWIPNQDVGCLAGASVVASECGRMTEMSGGYYPVLYDITTGMSLDRCLFRRGAALYVRSLYAHLERLVTSYERVTEQKGTDLWDRLVEDGRVAVLSEDAERCHVKEGHASIKLVNLELFKPVVSTYFRYPSAAAATGHLQIQVWRPV